MTHQLPVLGSLIGMQSSDELSEMDARDLTPVMVVLGSPGSQCQGHGICYIEEAQAGAVSVSSCQRSTALAKIANDGKLQLLFNPKEMCPGALKKHFSKNSFLIREKAAVNIPSLECVDYYVQPGNYAICCMQSNYILIQITVISN